MGRNVKITTKVLYKYWFELEGKWRFFLAVCYFKTYVLIIVDTALKSGLCCNIYLWWGCKYIEPFEFRSQELNLGELLDET